MSLKLAIWDLDGTLVDSRSSILKALQAAAISVGLEAPTYEEVRQIVGLSLLDAVQTMRPDLSLEHATAYAQAYKECFTSFQDDPDFHESLYPGADACLRRLKTDGWLLGMATGKSRRGIQRNVKAYGWDGLFDVAFCADDGPSKPHPHMLNANLTALGAAAHQAIMIGDTTHDIKMACDAGVYAIGVSWGFHTVAELQAAKAREVVHDFDELFRSLEAFGALLHA